MSTPAGEPLGDYGVVPEFALVERSGRPLGRGDLAGRPWVANFIFTRCPGICPTLSKGMAELERRVEARARLLSITVDPAHDDPTALTEYAGRFHASKDGWLFATGEPEAVRSLVSKGFHLAIAESPLGEKDPDGPITHSDRVALVGPDLRIRRYYRGTDGDWIERLLADLERLEAEA